MAGQLQTELYLHPRPGGQDLVERICAHATNRPTQEVVAVAVAPTNAAQASDLLFGTGIGVVSAIDHLSTDLIDEARRSVAKGATEIALPPLVLDHAATLTRLRSRVGPVTPVTVRMDDTHERLDVDAAERALRLGADFISYAPYAASPTACQDIAALLALAESLQLGGVKIEATDASHAALIQSKAHPAMARLCVPLASGSG